MLTYKLFASLSLAFFIPFCTVFAADHIVATTGPYMSIQDAIDAAANGDRIIIKPIGGTTRWIGNLNINKTLDFLCFDNNQPYYVQGTVTITPAAGRTVNIVGMNLSGSIGAATGSGSTKVNITDCTISSDIDLAGSSIEAYIGGNTLRNLTISYGYVVGNDLQGYYIYINNNYTGIVANPNVIVGNKCGGISYNSNTTFKIMNNFLYYYGIDVSHSPTTASTSFIENNSFYMISTGSALYLNTVSSLATLSIQNNAHQYYTSSGTRYFLGEASSSLGNMIVGYNYYTSATAAYSSPRTANHAMYNTGILISGAGISSTTGALNSGHAGINGGHPNNKYADLDLSRNDAGCYGGSYSHNNFFPIQTGSARVLFVEPSNTTFLQGQTLNLKAVGIDR